MLLYFLMKKKHKLYTYKHNLWVCCVNYIEMVFMQRNAVGIMIKIIIGPIMDFWNDKWL